MFAYARSSLINTVMSRTTRKKPDTKPAVKRSTKPSPESPHVRNSRATTILVLPDPHAHYLDDSADRATWAGRLAADLKPGIVVEMGDLADMPSLFAFDQPGR